MNDIERIRRRIHKTDNKSRKFNRLYSCMIFIMFSLSLFMGGLIVTKTPVSELINKIEPYIDMQKLMVFENWFLPSNQSVNSSLQYQLLEGSYFRNSSNMVYAISDGVVIYVNDDQVIVRNDNGILVTYGNLLDLQVKLDDRILKNSILGTYQDKVYLDFYENEEFISYEEALRKD